MRYAVPRLVAKACLASALLLTANAADVPTGGTRHGFEQVLPLLDADDPDTLRRVQAAIYGHPDWADRVVELMRVWLRAGPLSDSRERALTGILRHFADNEKVERFVTDVCANPHTSSAARRSFLRAFARVRIDPLPDPWIHAIGKALDDSDLSVGREAICTVRTRGLAGFDAKLQTMVEKTDLPVAMRVAALDSIIARRSRLSAGSFDLLKAQLSRTDAPLDRWAAARTLGAARLNPNQLRELSSVLAECQPTIGRLLLPAYSKHPDELTGRLLLDALKGSPTGAAVTLGTFDRLLVHFPENVQKAAKPVRERIVARSRLELARLDRLAAELPPGDEKRGREVFLSERATCTKCHRAAERGGGLGPNLSRIGFLRDQRDLLTSIVLPSAYVDPEFWSYVVVTRDGRLVAGVLGRETADAVYLQTGEKEEARVARGNVEDIILSPTSPMPEGMENLLSRQDLSDLVEFLVHLR
jgi:putative heme-binding domain-containing protein